MSHNVESESVSHSVVSDFLPPHGLHHAPPSMEFSRQEYWSGLSFPSPGDLPDPGIEPGFTTLQADALPSEPPGKPSTYFWAISFANIQKTLLTKLSIYDKTFQKVGIEGIYISASLLLPLPNPSTTHSEPWSTYSKPWSSMWNRELLVYVLILWSEVKWKLLGCAQLFVTPLTVACQALLSVGFSRQEYWNEMPFPSPGDLPNPGIEPRSPTLWAGSLLSEPPGKV